MERITLTIPHKDKKAATVNANPAAAPALAMPTPPAYLPPSRPPPNPAANSAATPAQPGYLLGNLPQPTDPRRAAAAKAANPGPAPQNGQQPGQVAPPRAAVAPGAGQYPAAAAGLGTAGASGQFGRALPADPRADPRVDPRTKSAFGPAGGYKGALYMFGILLLCLTISTACCTPNLRLLPSFCLRTTAATAVS